MPFIRLGATAEVKISSQVPEFNCKQTSIRWKKRWSCETSYLTLFFHWPSSIYIFLTRVSSFLWRKWLPRWTDAVNPLTQPPIIQLVCVMFSLELPVASRAKWTGINQLNLNWIRDQPRKFHLKIEKNKLLKHVLIYIRFRYVKTGIAENDDIW